jgi:hypothetical protein
MWPCPIGPRHKQHDCCNLQELSSWSVEHWPHVSHRRKPQLRLCPGETLHRERSGLTATCGCLFGFVYKKKPTYLERLIREESSQRAPPFFCGWRDTRYTFSLLSFPFPHGRV